MLNISLRNSGSAPISPALFLGKISSHGPMTARRPGETFLAARILPFRSLVSAAPLADFHPVTGAVCPVYTPRSAKVIVMSQYTRRRQFKESLQHSKGMFAKVDQEMAEGYLEVEITGMTLRRLLCVYGVMLRDAWAYTSGSVRSLVRVTPAH